MKKLLAVLISLSLVSNGSLYSMTKIKETTKRGVSKIGQFGMDVAAKTLRYWRCLTKPDTYGCSLEERKKARKWFIHTPTAIVVSLLAAAGIFVIGDTIAQAQTEILEAIEERSRELIAQTLQKERWIFETHVEKKKKSEQKMRRYIKSP